MKKRTWHYVQEPVAYDIACNLYGGSVLWSRFEKMVWCETCKKDLPGTPGILNGPVPIKLLEMMGISLNRWNMETKRIERMVVTEEGVGWK